MQRRKRLEEMGTIRCYIILETESVCTRNGKYTGVSLLCTYISLLYLYSTAIEAFRCKSSRGMKTSFELLSHISHNHRVTVINKNIESVKNSSTSKWNSLIIFIFRQDFFYDTIYKILLNDIIS